MDFKITPTKYRQMKFVTLTWDYDKHPINLSGPYLPLTTYSSPEQSDLIIPKGSVMCFAMFEIIKSLGPMPTSNLNIQAVVANDGATNINPIAFTVGSSNLAGTIEVGLSSVARRKYQNNSILQFVSYGVVTEGAVNFTIGYLPGGGYEYLNI